MIDYRVRTFLALCETMNYRKAAELLHVTQPAVTRHIQALEQEYGCKLLTYDRRKLELTEQGKTLLRYARNVAYQERRLEQDLVGSSGLSLRIGATKTVGDYVVGSHIARFLSRKHNAVEVYVDNTERLLGGIEHGELDFAVIEGSFDRKMFASKLYRQEPFVGLCASDHRFAGKSVQLEEAMEECLLLREHGSGTRAILEQALAAGSHTVEEFARVITISSFGLMIRLLAELGAVTFGYEAIQRNDDAIARFQVADWHIVHELNYVFLDNEAARAAVSAFAAFQNA